MVGWEDICLEAVECPLLLALFVGVVKCRHAGFEMSALSFDAETSIALLFNCLEGVTGGAALFAHHVELILKAVALLPVLVQVGLGLGVRSFKIGEGVLESGCQLLLSKQVLLDGTNASFLILDQLSMGNVLALVPRSGR
jgi:hypothetical protein